MSERHKDALAIQMGACNPSGVALSIVDACREARDEGKSATEDSAVRLMVHQLYHICGGWPIDHDSDTYGRLTKDCEGAANG